MHYAPYKGSLGLSLGFTQEKEDRLFKECFDAMFAVAIGKHPITGEENHYTPDKLYAAVAHIPRSPEEAFWVGVTAVKFLEFFDTR